MKQKIQKKLMLNYKNLVKIVEEALEIKVGKISKGDETELIEKWDSLGHLAILTKLDNQLDGRCAEIEELSIAYSIDEIADILRQKKLML